MKYIYIAGPYSNGDTVLNEQQYNRQKDWLQVCTIYSTPNHVLAFVASA